MADATATLKTNDRTTARDVLLAQRASDQAELKALLGEIKELRRRGSSFFVVPGPMQLRERELRANLERVARELAALDDQEAGVLRAAADVDRRLAHDRAEFWFRRFFTSLGLGNGAAFAAISAGLLQAQRPEELASTVFVPLILFAIGTVMAGLVPFALYWQNAASPGVLDWNPRTEAAILVAARWAVIGLTALSSFALLAGVVVALIGVHDLADRAARAHAPPSGANLAPTSPKVAPAVRHP